MTPDLKPLVNVACLCEKALHESDGVLSLIRIVDTYRVGAPPAVIERLNPHLVLTLVVNLKANGLVGKHDITIVLVGSDGKAQAPQTITVDFPDAGPVSGANFLIQVEVGEVKNYGDKRFDVLYKGALLTSVPFRLQPSPDATNAAAEQQK